MVGVKVVPLIKDIYHPSNFLPSLNIAVYQFQKVAPPPLILGWLRPYFPRSLIQISLESHLIFFWNLSLKTSYFLQKKKLKKLYFFYYIMSHYRIFFTESNQFLEGKKSKKKFKNNQSDH